MQRRALSHLIFCIQSCFRHSGTWNIDRVGTRTIAHEFGHLLGAGHGPNRGENLLTQSAYAKTGVANANDYGRALGGAINAHLNQSRPFEMRGILPANPSGMWTRGQPTNYKSTQELRAGRFWWN
jgi:hypothetical protein